MLCLKEKALERLRVRLNVILSCYNVNQKRTTTLRKTKEELLKMAPEDLFMELIRDIANELNVNQLCHKILVNVCVLVS